MFNPVGPKRPAVYWRRRVVLLGSVLLILVLLILTIRAVTARSAAPPAAAPATSPSARIDASPPAVRSSTAPTSATRTSAPLAAPASSLGTVAGHSARGAAAKPSSSPPPRPCSGRDLSIAALPTQSHFAVGSTPLLGVEVTDVGSAPCVQDLSDRQVLLQVYDGASRVWGSHDCTVQPGSDPRTLAVGRPVRIALAWSGLTSSPGCGGRQRVGAGSYTLYASVSGRTGTATTFTVS